MKSLQIFLLSLLVIWQGWRLSENLSFEHDLQPVEPMVAWEASISGPQLTVWPARPAQLGTIMSAAVFSPSRKLAARPAPVIARAPVKQPAGKKPKPVPMVAKLPGLQLEGVMLSLSQEMALVRVADTQKRKWLRLDEKFQGWTLIAITPTEILLESEKSQIKVPLYVDNK